MKIGAVIIHSSKFTESRPVVDSLISFFKYSEVEVNVIEGVFTDEVYFDAREGHDRIKKEKGAIGYALAHVNALKLGIDKGYAYMFIFEDDIEIKVESYPVLKKWIDAITIDYDVLLLAYSGCWEGKVGAIRTHFKNYINSELIQGSALIGTMSYYISKESMNLLYDIQKKSMDDKTLFNSDGLHCNGRRPDGDFLTLIGPSEKYRFFMHHDDWRSVLATTNKF